MKGDERRKRGSRRSVEQGSDGAWGWAGAGLAGTARKGGGELSGGFHLRISTVFPKTTITGGFPEKPPTQQKSRSGG